MVVRVSYTVPIRLSYDPETEWTPPTPRKRPRRGEVETETITEYREVTDDADFGSFGNFETQRDLAKSLKVSPGRGLLGKLTGGDSGTKAKAKASSSESSSDEEEAKEDFEKQALEAHNAYRKRHGVKSLKFSKKLTAYAQEWADKLAREDSFEHRQNNTYGENLYSSWSSNPKAKITGNTPVDSWYSEVKKHDFTGEPRTTGTGHFTQVVWKGSKEMGIAQAKSKSNKIIVVANYDPPGNFVGRYSENVAPPSS